MAFAAMTDQVALDMKEYLVAIPTTWFCKIDILSHRVNKMQGCSTRSGDPTRLSTLFKGTQQPTYLNNLSLLSFVGL